MRSALLAGVALRAGGIFLYLTKSNHMIKEFKQFA
jgi:hypothetical protein